jgi:hypothetical protein
MGRKETQTTPLFAKKKKKRLVQPEVNIHETKYVPITSPHSVKCHALKADAVKSTYCLL